MISLNYRPPKAGIQMTTKLSGPDKLTEIAAALSVVQMFVTLKGQRLLELKTQQIINWTFALQHTCNFRRPMTKTEINVIQATIPPIPLLLPIQPLFLLNARTLLRQNSMQRVKKIRHKSRTLG